MTASASHRMLLRVAPLVIVLPGCDAPSEHAPGGMGAGASAHATATASRVGTGPPTAPSAVGSALTVAPFAGQWQGSFRAEAVPVALPKGVREAGWSGDDGRAATGDGTVAIAIDEAGQVTGTAKGALGELSVRGMVDDDTLRAGLAPAAGGGSDAMAGILVGDARDGAFELMLRASSLDARKVRGASLRLERR